MIAKTFLSYAMALAATVATTQLQLASADDEEWNISEEEKNEAYNKISGRSSSRSKTQIKLDPLQICLFPTYLTFPEDVLQVDLRDTVQDLVSTRLEKEFGDDFVYFAVTDASIDWYSGEESQPVCGSLDHRLPSPQSPSFLPSSPKASPRGSHKEVVYESGPCTCALYSGAVVLLKIDNSDGIEVDPDVQLELDGQNDPFGGGNVNASSLSSAVDPDADPDADADADPSSVDILEPRIASVLIEELVSALRDKPEPSESEDLEENVSSRMPFYTELKGASVSWNAADRKPGGKLYLTPSFDGDEDNVNDQQLVTEDTQLGDLGQEQHQLTNANATVVPTINEDLEGAIIDVVNINAAQQSESNSIDGGNSSKANAFQTTKGKVLAGVFGGLLLVALVAVLYYLCRSRYHSLNRRGLDDDDDFDLRLAKETGTVVSIGDDDDYQDRVDEEIANPTDRRRQTSTTSSTTNGDAAARTRTSATSSSFSSMEDDQDCEDVSAAAQYVHNRSNHSSSINTNTNHNNSILDCISVGSEWTGVTGVTSALGLTSGSSNHNKTTAEMVAAKETFDRDRQITLQKDMLQSEWTTPTTGTVGITDPNNNNNNLHIYNNHNSALQFQDATGQGEEIFIMEPASSGRR